MTSQRLGQRRRGCGLWHMHFFGMPGSPAIPSKGDGLMRCVAYAAGALLLSFGLAAPAVAEVEKVLITYQPGLIFMPLILAGKNKLIQKHAAAAGLSDLTVDWVPLTSGGASVEALISGNIDVV